MLRSLVSVNLTITYEGIKFHLDTKYSTWGRYLVRFIHRGEYVMKHMPFTFFRYAGPNDFVAFTRAGRERKSGMGLAGLLALGTSVVVVPLGVKTVNFAVTERSMDGQLVDISGELVVVNTAEMREFFDFSVYPHNGQYRNDPTVQIEDQVRIAVRAPIRATVARLSVEDIGRKMSDVADALRAEVANDESELMQHLNRYAIRVESVSVKSALPYDEDLAEALGAEERESLLAAADDAVADRRLQAAHKDREVRTYEEETALTLVQEQAQRVEQEGKNKIAQADAESQATTKLLEPYGDKEPGAMLALAILEASKRGVRSMSIDPGLLAAVRGAASREDA